MGNVDDEIRARLNTFTEELGMLVRRAALEAVQKAFGHDGHVANRPAPVHAGHAAPRAAAAPRPAAPRPAAPPPAAHAPAKAPAKTPAKASAKAPAAARAKHAAARKPGQKRDPKELTGLIERLADYIRSHPGHRVIEIKEALGVAATDLRFPIRKLLAAGRIAAKGTKQTTTYTPR